YEPRFGRFLERDPLTAAGSASLAHPYMFAGGDPVSRIDPSGMCPEGQNCTDWSDPVSTGIAIGQGLRDLFGGGHRPRLPDTSFKDITLVQTPLRPGTMLVYAPDEAPYLPSGAGGNLTIAAGGNAVTLSDCNESGCWNQVSQDGAVAATWIEATEV